MNDLNGLPDDVLREWLELLRTDKPRADDLYFQTILPLVLTSIDTNAEHQAIRERKCNVLVSLMGFSPETTVITTHVVRPERVLIVLSGKAEQSLDRAYDFLRKMLPHSRIHQLPVDPIDPTDIYNKVKGFVEQYGGQNPRHIFDVTGGKKIMSATAGQVAWELDMPLCYVEGAYDPVIRRPRPGTEQVMLLGNPSRQRTDNARQNALGVYRSGNFARAAGAFRESANLRTDTRLEELGVALCNTYAAWSDLDFAALRERLNELDALRRRPVMAECEKQALDPAALDRQVAALRAVTEQQPLARTASYLELASVYRDMRRHDFACLLIYRCMEALVEYGLRRAGGGTFEPGAPDYALFGDPAALTERYVALSKKADIGGQPDDRLPHQVGMVNGIKLLCLVADVHDREPHRMLAKDYVGRIADVAKLRNSSVLAHGDRTLTLDDCDKILGRTLELAEKLLGNELPEMQSLQRRLKPLALR